MRLTTLCSRANKKLIGTYLKKLSPESLPEDGRLKGKFLSMGARTGRFSAQGILQTIPRKQEIRELFVPEEGNCFVIADYSQIELRVSAELSGEKVMQEAFEKDEDLHRLTASKAFGVQLSEVSKEQRTAAKAINFGLIYGMSPKGLVAYMKSFGIGISLAEAQQFPRCFLQTLWELQALPQYALEEGRTENSGKMVRYLLRNTIWQSPQAHRR